MKIMQNVQIENLVISYFMKKVENITKTNYLSGWGLRKQDDEIQ